MSDIKIVERPIYIAARDGVPQAVFEEIGKSSRTSASFRLNDTDENGRTLLHLLLAEELSEDAHLQCLKLLVRNGVSLNAQDSFGHTPLHIAVLCYHPRAVTLFLKLGADWEVRDKDGRTPHDLAERLGHKDLVRKFLKAKALTKVNSTRSITRASSTASWKASSKEVDTAASEILTAAASLVDKQSDVGRLQSPSNSSESKRSGSKHGALLLQNVSLRNADTSDNESAELNSSVHLEQKTLTQQRALNHQLFTACRYGSGAAKLWKLINDGANINCYDQDHRTPLHYACLFGHSECVRSMITEPDINLFVRDTTSEGLPFPPSLASGEAVMPGGVKTAGGKTPLHFAALGGHCPVLHAILQVYPEENYHDSDAFGCNALHLAAEQGHMLAGRMLMEHGFDIEAKTHIGYTAMHLAANRGHQPVIGELMNFGAEPDPATEEGNTPLHLAASKGLINVVNLLIKHGASCHLKDKYDRTALHWASVNGHEIVVQRLIEVMEDGNEGDPKRKRRETVISDPFSCLMVNQMYCSEFGRAEGN